MLDNPIPLLDNPIPLLGITILVVLAGLFAIRPLRRAVITRPIFSAYRKVLPQMSETERDALEAGSVWWEGELFRGKPDWKKLHAYPVPTLTPAEQSFLDNECEEACRLVDDWKVTHELYDLPHEAWRYIKDKGFLGMIIPKKYGGLEFSAYAHSQVVTKLSTRSSALSVSVMVPNSLGPAELLLHYGTEEQKNHYLPRLAKGIEVPAFALTSPWAGSDAASIPDTGVICKGLYQGKEVLGMRVSWDKRYITLAPVCTVFGLAFHLFDPDGLLGDKKHIGITCALVPYDHPGVDTGRRPGAGHRPGAHRRRDCRLRHAGSRTGHERRPHRRPAGRPADHRAGHHHQPLLLLRPAGRSRCGQPDPPRPGRRDDRRRHRVDVDHAADHGQQDGHEPGHLHR